LTDLNQRHKGRYRRKGLSNSKRGNAIGELKKKNEGEKWRPQGAQKGNEKSGIEKNGSEIKKCPRGEKGYRRPRKNGRIKKLGGEGYR